MPEQSAQPNPDLEYLSRLIVRAYTAGIRCVPFALTSEHPLRDARWREVSPQGPEVADEF